MSSKLHTFVIAVVCFLIPKTFKRLVFISTLYAKGAEEKIFAHVDYARLNKNMNIATNYKAIESALCLQQAVWRDIDLNQLLKDSASNPLDGERVPGRIDLNLLTDKIIDSLPSWIRYSREEMSVDAKSVFSGEAVNIHA